MKTADAALTSFLSGISGDASCWRADLFTITLLDGVTVYRWTSADFDISYGGNTFSSGGGPNAPICRRTTISQSSSLSIDTFDLEILSGSNPSQFTIGGSSVPALAVAGYFDGARIRIDHMIGAYPGDTTKGCLTNWFVGGISNATPEGSSAVLRCKSDLEKLNVELPRFVVRHQCGNTVYDSACGILRSAYTLGGRVDSATTISIVADPALAMAAKADGYYDLGILTFTSGALSGVTRSVRSWLQSTLTLVLTSPLRATPAADDLFTISPGCDRSRDVCLNTFNNLAQFRGFSVIPMPEAGSK